jgi:hypothetical protein
MDERKRLGTLLRRLKKTKSINEYQMFSAKHLPQFFSYQNCKKKFTIGSELQCLGTLSERVDATFTIFVGRATMPQISENLLVSMHLLGNS